jgi:bla regulator protein blaR1
MFAHAAAWLLTYALHSTLLLGLAWLASGPLARRSIRLEELAWRAALLGALATSTFQVATGWHPAATFRLPLAVAATPTSPVPAPIVSIPLYKEEVASTTQAPAAPVAQEALTESAPSISLALESPASTPVPEAARPSAGPRWLQGLIACWALAAFLLTLRLAFAHLGLRHRLRSRLEVVDGTLARILARLAPAAGLARPIKLSCSHELPVPVALGVLRPEIAVPPRVLSHLSAGEQESLLAHELAHLVRRDPAWLVAGQLLASLLFFQPLNWVARRRLREISELLCDEWAVGRTGEPLSLARCLAEVAQWSLEPVRLLPVPGMADRPSNLGRRIHRLLDGERPGARLPRWGLAALAVLLLSVAAVAPGFSAQETPPAPPSPAVAPAPEVPPVPASAAEPAEAPEPPQPGELPASPAGVAPPPPPPALPAHPAPRAPRTPRAPRAPKAAPARPAPPATLPHHGLTAEERAHLDALRERAESMAEIAGKRELSEEQIRRLEADAERMSREIEERLKPQLEQIEKLAAQAAAQRPDEEEMKALEKEVEAATRHRRSPEDEARFEADVRKLAESSAAMSAEERQRLQQEVKKMAESMRPSREEMEAIKKLAARHREMAHQLSAEQRQQMEAARREIQKEMEAMRETLRRDLDRDLKSLHEELRREREHRQALPRPKVPATPNVAPTPKIAPVPRPRAPRPPRPEAAPRPEARPAPPPPPPALAPSAPPAPPRGAIPGGVKGGVPGGIAGGVPGGVAGGVPGGVEGGVPGGIEGGVDGGPVPPPPPAAPPV